jgi:hypothetical protein
LHFGVDRIRSFCAETEGGDQPYQDSTMANTNDEQTSWLDLQAGCPRLNLARPGEPPATGFEVDALS